MIPSYDPPMLLHTHLASLEHYDTLESTPPDAILLRWEHLGVDHQATANAYRLFTGKALADRIDAAPRGTAKDVLADWIAKTNRKKSTWNERKRVGKRFFEILEKHAERSKELDLSILDCAFTEILPRLEAALGIESEPDEDPPDERGPWRLVDAMLQKLVSMVGEGRPARERLAAMLTALATQLLAPSDEEPVDDEPTLATPGEPVERPSTTRQPELAVEPEPELAVEVEVDPEVKIEVESEPARDRDRDRDRARGRARTPERPGRLRPDVPDP